MQVDSKTQAYLDDYLKRKKEMLAAANSVTLTPANLAEVCVCVSVCVSVLSLSLSLSLSPVSQCICLCVSITVLFV